MAATAASTGPGVLTGAVTAAIAFFAAGLTEFPGVAQLGVIAGGGVLLCWLAQTTVLPAIIRLLDADGVKRDLPMPLDLRFWLRPLFAFPRLTLTAAVAATLVVGVGLRYLRMTTTCCILNRSGWKASNWSTDSSTKPIAARGSRCRWPTRWKKCAARKEAFLRLPSVERVEEIATELPQGVQRKRPIIERIHGRLANLPQQAPQIPVTPADELARVHGCRRHDASRDPRRGTGCRRTATIAGHVAADSSRGVPPPGMRTINRRWRRTCLHGCVRCEAASTPEPPH